MANKDQEVFDAAKTITADLSVAVKFRLASHLLASIHADRRFAFTSGDVPDAPNPIALEPKPPAANEVTPLFRSVPKKRGSVIRRFWGGREAMAEILKVNPGRAYGLDEMLNALHARGLAMTRNAVTTLFSELVKLGVAIRVRVGVYRFNGAGKIGTPPEGIEQQ